MVSDYINVAVKGLQEVYKNGVQASIMQYKDAGLFNFRTTAEYTELFTSTEGMSGFKKLAEGETPPTLVLDQGYSIQISEERFGGSITITETMIRQSKSNQEKIKLFLDEQRNQLMRGGEHEFISSAHALYNGAFNSSAEKLAPDGVELCGTHHWKAGGSASFTNKTTNILSTTSIALMNEYGGDFKDSSGKPMPITFDTIVVKKGSVAHNTAIALFLEKITPTKVGDVNIYEGGMYKVIATPYINNKLHWFGLASRMQNPLYVGIGELPTLKDPIQQNNEDVRINSTGFWKTGITNLPFAIYGGDGSA